MIGEWLDVYKKGKVSNNTYVSYRDSIRLRIARIGEVLGISWDDIDLKNSIIHSRHSLKQNKITHKFEIGSTKTCISIIAGIATTHKYKRNRLLLHGTIEAYFGIK